MRQYHKDRESNLPYKGEIIRDQSFESFFEKSSVTAGRFIQAIRDGKRQEWIKDFYNSDFEISDDSVIADIYSYASAANGLLILQCMSCGRIFISSVPFAHMNPQCNNFVCFKPEDDDWQNILAVNKDDTKQADH